MRNPSTSRVGIAQHRRRLRARFCGDAGAAGVMIATYYKQASVAIGSDVPFVIQDYPLTLYVQMTPAVIRRMVMENSAWVMLTHEDWPGLGKITTLRGYERDGSMRHISILCGNNALFLDFEMERGADGANTGYCFPDRLADGVHLSAAGKRDEAHDLFDAHLPLIRYEQQPGPGLAVRKYVMMKRGIIAHDTLRKPGAALSAVAKQRWIICCHASREWTRGQRFDRSHESQVRYRLRIASLAEKCHEPALAPAHNDRSDDA